MLWRSQKMRHKVARKLFIKAEVHFKDKDISWDTQNFSFNGNVSSWDSELTKDFYSFVDFFHVLQTMTEVEAIWMKHVHPARRKTDQFINQ